MPVAGHPLHRSGRAELPHPAPVLGDDRMPQARPLRRVRMTDVRCGNPALHLRFEACPCKVGFLTPAPQRLIPETGHMVCEGVQAGTVQGHTIVLVVASQNRAYPFTLFPQVGMHASPKFLLQFIQLRLHSLPHRLAIYRKPALPCLTADVREAKKVEGLRFALAPLPPVARCVPSKLDQSSLSFMQLQVEFAHPLAQFPLEPFSVLLMLEADNEVVRVSHDDHRSPCLLLTPSLHPLVEDVVKIDIRKYLANHSSFRSPLFAPFQPLFFHHSSSEPFLDQSRDSSVTYPVLDHLSQPFVGDAVKEPSNVCIKHP